MYTNTLPKLMRINIFTSIVNRNYLTLKDSVRRDFLYMKLAYDAHEPAHALFLR